MTPFQTLRVPSASSVPIALDLMARSAPRLRERERYQIVLDLDQSSLALYVQTLAERVESASPSRRRDAEAATSTPRQPVAACPAGGEDFVSRAYAAIRSFGKRKLR